MRLNFWNKNNGSKKDRNELKHFVSRFVNITNDPKVQLNIYRENGQVLFQLFKTKNVLGWAEKFDFDDRDGHIVVISFNKEKSDNNGVIIRFRNSSWYNSFVKMSANLGDSYYYYFDNSKSEDEIGDLLNEMFSDFYGVLSNVRFEVASW